MGSHLDATPGTTLRSIMRERRSVRRYLAKPIPHSLIETLIEAAGWAPSAHNRQPWRFVLIDRADDKLRLATAMSSRLRADRNADGDNADAIERDAINSERRITASPLVIAVSQTLADMDQYPDTRRTEAERLMAVQSTAMAVQNLLLLAHAHGLGTCWMCAPLFCPATVKAALTLPADWEPQALITVGYPAAPARMRTRRPLADIIRR